MTDKLSWRTLMETRTEKRTKLQTPALVAIIIGLHVTAVGSVVFIQGCGSPKPQASEPPAAIVMPPKGDAPKGQPSSVTPPVFQPPVAVQQAPRTLPDAEAKVYEVRPGDSLSVIARRSGVSTAAIMDLNKISDPNKIRVGQKLLLPPDAKVSATPAPAASAAPALAPRASAPSAAAVEGGSTYVVQAGDSLSSIARRHGVTSARLIEVNKIADANRIRVGQKLTIPDGSAKAPEAPTPTASPAPAPVPAPAPAPVVAPTPVAPAQPQFSGASESFTYTVRAGDTLDSIAGDFTVLRTELIMLNNLTGSETLRPGQTLLIPPFTQP